MADVRRIYVEKKDAFAVKAKELQEDFPYCIFCAVLSFFCLFMKYTCHL